MKLFIADNSTILRNHLATILNDIAGIEIIGEAETTAEAIQKIPRLKPDLVILDIQMPSEGGIAVLKSIKDQHPKTRVAMFTAYPFPQYRQRCLEAGADYFFDKSTESDHLILLIKELNQQSKQD
jgi:DNA-binding NarL/FixJ family response regulator